MKIKDINQSYSLIQVSDLNFQIKLMNLLSVYSPGYQYTPQYKSGQWDGKIHFYKVTPHGLVIPKGLVDIVIAKYGYALEEPYKPIFEPEQITMEELDNFIKELNLPFEPRQYQKEAVLTMINKARGIIISATGCIDKDTKIDVYIDNKETKLKAQEIKRQIKNIKFIYNGYKEITDVFTKKDKGKHIILEDGKKLKCSITHFLYSEEKINNSYWVPTGMLKEGMKIKTKDGYKKIVKILDLPEQEWIDFEVEGEVYYANDIVSHNSGKSLIIYIFLMYMYKQGKKSVLIVPNVSLVEQMKSDFIDYGFKNLDDLHIIYAGKEKHFNAPISVATWQSIHRNKELFEDIDCIICDEAHRAKASSLQDIIQASINAPYKIGLTGTLPDDPVTRFTLTGALGKSYTIVTPKQLIDMGYATPVYVNAMFLQYSEEVIKQFRKECKTYQQEVKWIENNTKRNDIITKLALKLKSKNENVLMLYNRINHGELLLKLLIKNLLNLENLVEDMEYRQKPSNKSVKIQLVQEGKTEGNIININDYNIYFIRGDVDVSKREDIRNLLENKKGAILIDTYGTLSTGVNIKNLHHLFFTSSTKSYVMVNQSIGRGMRQHKSKDKIYIWDFIDDLSGYRKSKNYMLKHFNERVNYYLKQGYEIKDLTIQIKE